MKLAAIKLLAVLVILASLLDSILYRKFKAERSLKKLKNINLTHE